MRRARPPRSSVPGRAAARPGLPLLLLLSLVGAACNPGRPGCAPALPPLEASTPVDGAVDVPRSAWIVLRFRDPVPARRGLRFTLACAGEAGTHGVRVSGLDKRSLVVNPDGELPAGDTCALAWRGRRGTEVIRFATAVRGAPVAVVHDRTDPSRVAPYPDDVLLAEDPDTVTGWRHDVAAPTASTNHDAVFGALLQEANLQDGFSPLAPMVVELSGPVDPATLPADPAASLDPLASLALVDLTPRSKTFGHRVPFRVEVRNGDTTPFGLRSDTLLLFPSIPLEPRGRYGLYVTRRVGAGPGSPLEPSPYFEAVLAPPAPGEDPVVTNNRERLEDVLEAGELLGRPPLPPEDLAFAASVSVRSLASIQDDVQVIKRHVLAAPPAALELAPGDPDAVRAEPAEHVAALVRGTWEAPDWRDGAFLARDAEGRPRPTGTRSVCFRLALPEAALDGPVPVVIYQHGNPGEAETEVLRNAARFLAEAGYAVIGFTDVLNGEVAPPSGARGPACARWEDPAADDESRITLQVFSIVLDLLSNGRLPDHWTQTLADQLAFVRAVGALDGLDLLPLGAPDGVPDLDPSALLYMGISEGGNNGQALAAYAPELRAGALVVGGARLIETLLHQQADTFLGALPLLFPELTPADIWTAAALFQVVFDRQDKHNHGRFVYRSPAEVPVACPGLETCLETDYCRDPDACTNRKPSLLLTEGLDDSLVPNHATESAAWQMGPMPHLAPVQRVVPFLDVAEESVTGNVDGRTTAAFYQFVPDGVPGVPITPGCQSPPLSERSSNEGHFCAQSAVEARAQRLLFFDSALDPRRKAPVVVDPLPFYPEGTPLFPLPDLP